MVTPIRETRVRPDAPLPATDPVTTAPDPARLKPVPEPKPLDPLLTRRDPDFIRWVYPYLSWFTDHYYRTEAEGIELLPEGPFMAVGTHNGGIHTPDLYCELVAFWRRFGLETPAYGLMHSAAFKVPVLGTLLPKVGAIEANIRNGQTVLRSGFPLLICPGGDMDVLKPFRSRHRITFGTRRGFIRLAIREQVPIYPVVSVGAHETLFFLNDGKRLAELLGISRLFRIKAVPLALSFPFGITPAGLFSIPLPSKIVVKILPHIELAEKPESAHDERVVRRCFDHVVETMQRGLDELASRRRHVILG